MYDLKCSCGHRSDGIESRSMAEVKADVHESSQVRRAYRHAVEILPVRLATVKPIGLAAALCPVRKGSNRLLGRF